MPTENPTHVDLILRPPEKCDSGEILRWRNDSTTRAMSINRTTVKANEHEVWFARILANNENFAYVGEVGNIPVGWVRFTPVPDANAYLVSITIAPEYRSKGLGRALLSLGLEKFRQEHTNVVIRAQIKTNNPKSRRIFQQNGFVHLAIENTLETLILY